MELVSCRMLDRKLKQITVIMLNTACVHAERPALEFFSVQQQQLAVWQSSCMTVCTSVCHLFISLSVHSF